MKKKAVSDCIITRGSIECKKNCNGKLMVVCNLSDPRRFSIFNRVPTKAPCHGHAPKMRLEVQACLESEEIASSTSAVTSSQA